VVYFHNHNHQADGPIMRTRLYSFLAFCLLSFDRAGSSRTPPDCDAQTSRYDPLTCWLWKLTIHIPNQEFREGIFKVEIDDMVCSNFELTNIASQYIPSSDVMDPYVPISVAAISATCDGKYKTTGCSGVVTASVLSPHEPALAMSIFVRSNSTEHHMATSVSAQNCTSDLLVPADTLHFEGSISARIIDLFKGSISGYVSTALSTQLCPPLTSLINDKATSWIEKADACIVAWIENKTEYNSVALMEQRALVSTHDALNFRRDTPLLVSMVELANLFVNRYLNKGLFLDFMEWLGYEDVMDYNCGYSFRGINGLVKSLVNGRINVKLPINSKFTYAIPNYALLTVQIKRIEFSGLDGLDIIQLMKVTAGSSLSSFLKSQTGFNISAALNITVSPIDGGMFQGDPLEESFHVYVDVSNVTSGVTLNTDIDLSLFEQIQVGHVISAVKGNNQILGCLVNPLLAIQVHSLSAILRLQGVAFDPDGPSSLSLEDDMDAILNNMLQLFLGEYPDFVSEAFDGYVRGPGREALNRLSIKWIEILRKNFPLATCEHVEISNATDYFDFSKYGIFSKMNEFLNRSKVLASANTYLNCLAENFVLQVGSPRTKFADFTWILRNLSFGSVGSIQSLAFLSPDQDGLRLQNNVAFGHSTFASSLDVNATNLTGTANITVSKGETFVSAIALILYDLNKVRPMSIADLMKSGYCFTVPANDFVLYNVAATLNKIQIMINAAMKGLTPDIIEFRFDSAQYPLLPTIVESIFSWGVSTVFDSVNNLSSYLLSRSNSICKGTDENENEDDDDITKNVGVDLLWLVMLFIFANFAFVVFRDEMARRWFHDVHSEDFADSHVFLRPLIEAHSDDDDNLLTYTAEPKSILETKQLSSLTRHCFPILIIGTIALLIASNLSVGASVDMTISLPTKAPYAIPSLFAFSLGHTIEEMYSAGIWTLLLVVVVFSGIWPYLKLALMLVAWVAPPDFLSKSQRGDLLFSLDALGKFSLVDTFVLVLMMVSFRYHLEAGGSTLDVYVNPKFGFYGFLLATSLSLVAGHIALFIHRHAVKSNQSISSEKESLFQHGFVHGVFRKRLSWFSRALILVLLIAAFVLLAIGATQKSFVFDIGGLAGTLLGDNSRQSYSMITLGVAISQSVEDPSSIGIKCLQGIYFFYSIITPFSCLLALVVVLVFPLTLVHQQRLMVLAEVTNAWSAIEVFALSMVAALFQISTFASFIIGDKCDVINLLLRDNFRDLIAGDDVCFSVDASVRTNVVVLLFGVLINSFIVSLLLRLANVAIKERHSSEDHLGEIESLLEPMTDVNQSIPLVQHLMQSTFRGILFTDVTDELD